MIAAITPQDATERGLRVLAGPYKAHGQEREWLEFVCADLRRGGIEFGVVTRADGSVEVWRSGIGFRKDTK